MLSGCSSKGTVSYTAEMPDVFYRSKINLNLTLRSITSGIPLRADILGCGGFLLSNYQPELCEYFTPDVDFVYFNDMDDLDQRSTTTWRMRKNAVPLPHMDTGGPVIFSPITPS